MEDARVAETGGQLPHDALAPETAGQALSEVLAAKMAGRGRLRDALAAERADVCVRCRTPS